MHEHWLAYHRSFKVVNGATSGTTQSTRFIINTKRYRPGPLRYFPASKSSYAKLTLAKSNGSGRQANLDHYRRGRWTKNAAQNLSPHPLRLRTSSCVLALPARTQLDLLEPRDCERHARTRAALVIHGQRMHLNDLTRRAEKSGSRVPGLAATRAADLSQGIRSFTVRLQNENLLPFLNLELPSPCRRRPLLRSRRATKCCDTRTLACCRGRAAE